MDQTDQFYEELPYTLQEQHLDADYIILGTGLQESALAAYLAKMEGKKVLIFDQQKTYGSSMKTVTLKQLVHLSQNQTQQRLYEFYVPPKYQQKNQLFFKESLDNKTFRGYNIDIEPSVFFGNSITCESLKQADMDKYMDFRLVNHLFMFEKGKFQEVPLSKGKIFQSKTLSLMEKKTLLTSLHTLIKLYQKHANIQEDQNSTKQFDKGFAQVSQELFNFFNENLQQNFRGLLQKITKNNKKIMNFIAYIVCNYQHNYSNALPDHVKESFKVKNFIVRFGKFINSCGIYGESPYLYVDNGMGDIPQAFSRIASIFGSTFILHPKLTIDSIDQAEDFVRVKSNIAPGKQLKVKQLFYGQTFERLYGQNNKSTTLESQQILRVLLLCKKLGNQQQCPSIGYFLDLEPFKNPVSLFIFDQSTHTCPSGYVLYQFSTILDKAHSNQSLRKKDQMISFLTQNLISKLTEMRGNSFEESIVFSSSYIRKNNVQVEQNGKDESYGKEKQVLLKGFGGLDLDHHFENFSRIVGKKENYFRKKNPYQEDCQEDSDEDMKNNILQRLDSISFEEKAQVNIASIESAAEVSEEGGNKQQINENKQQVNESKQTVKEDKQQVNCDQQALNGNQQLLNENNQELGDKENEKDSQGDESKPNSQAIENKLGQFGQSQGQGSVQTNPSQYPKNQQQNSIQ